MIRQATQTTRTLAVFTPLGDDKLLLRRFEGREEVSRLFAYDLELLSADDAIDPAGILGRNVTFLIQRDQSAPRYFNGFVNRFAQTGRTELAATYQAHVVPWLWFLTQTADCRIFQNKTTPQIVEQIFRDLGFSDFDISRLKADYPPREYCVQYRETDFDFVSRLMEEEGLFYFFRHQNGQHTLMLADDPSAYFTIDDRNVATGAADGTREYLDQLITWEHGYQYRPGRWSQTDYNFKTPRTDLRSEEPSVVRLPNNQVFEVYDYPGRFADTDLSRTRTRLRMEECEAAYDQVTGTATYGSFSPGGRFTVKGHHNAAEVGRSYVLTAVEHVASVNTTYLTGPRPAEVDFEVSFTCVPAEVRLRPASITPKPFVHGPQTATVVGPKGEQIYPDEFGRVKVQFHWDREGNYDEHSSCWLRVSQKHAGKGWGDIDLPRIGEEVIVSFLEGDPDRPIIKGRVYNGANQPPFGLPEAMTRSGGKTDTHKGSGYNEMTMDDTAGQEQLRVNAQYNMDTVIGNNETLQVGVDRSTDIGHNDTLTIAVDAAEEVGNNKSSTVGVNQDEVVGSNIVIEAGTAITLACGASTIHMNKGGVITISGTFVSSLAKANHCIVAPMTEIAGSNMLLQAGVVALDLGGICHVKGGETALNGATIDIRGGLTLLQGAPLKLGEVGAPLAKLPPGGSGGSGGSGAGGAGQAGKGPSDAPDGAESGQVCRTPDKTPLNAQQQESVDKAIGNIKDSEFGQTEEGRRVVAALEAKNQANDIDIVPACARGDANYRDTINLEPQNFRDPKELERILVHEGTHAADDAQFPGSRNAIENEIRAFENQLDYYAEQRENGYPNASMDKLAEAYANSANRNAFGDYLKSEFPQSYANDPSGRYGDRIPSSAFDQNAKPQMPNKPSLDDISRYQNDLAAWEAAQSRHLRDQEAAFESGRRRQFGSRKGREQAAARERQRRSTQKDGLERF